VRCLVERAPDERGEHVLYWMTMYRRPGWNFALERAAQWAKRLGRPVVILEALRLDYPCASERLHRFILEGMDDNARAFAGRAVLYYPYVEPEPGAAKGLLAALARNACVVVGDDFPAFMLPRMAAAAASQLSCRFELVDSNGLLPMPAAPRVFERAVDFRRFLQKALPEWLERMPEADPLEDLEVQKRADVAPEITEKWPVASGDLAAIAQRLPVDHDVKPAAMRGGHRAAGKRLDHFLDQRLERYAEDRQEPGLDATSRLSPYLHFGHISVHEIFARLAARERWSASRLSKKANGKKDGRWGMSPGAEAFLDELVTWRELAFNFCVKRPEDYDRYESLPAWARATLEAHERDPRPALYSLEELEKAKTHDPLWNAAQTQLVREGWFHGYLRMLWAKKILEWSPHPREALERMIRLMNKYSLDGRNPNSYAGYAWALGRYDRPWPPERPIFGTVRYMSSKNAARKLELEVYLRRYA
jgi:deoxyribodipyrimidine photo-lyase